MKLKLYKIELKHLKKELLSSGGVFLLKPLGMFTTGKKGILRQKRPWVKRVSHIYKRKNTGSIAGVFKEKNLVFASVRHTPRHNNPKELAYCRNNKNKEQSQPPKLTENIFSDNRNTYAPWCLFSDSPADHSIFSHK